MKWVIATPSLPPQVAGPAAYAAGIGEELLRRGYSVRIVPYGRLERSFPPIMRHALYLSRILPAVLRADIVLALDTWSVGLPALFAARLTGRKFMVRIGGDFLWESYVERSGEEVLLSEFYGTKRRLSLKERFVYAATRFLLARADAMLFTTPWQRDMWRRAYGFAPRRAHVLENVFPGRERGAPARGRVFVAAGRSVKLKNMSRLARVFARVSARHGDVALDTRTLPPAEHSTRIVASYALIVPSYSEVNPNTIADAIRFGKPFIATKDTGARERLGDVGLFIDTRDEAALEHAIETLLGKAAYEAAAARVRAFSFVRGWREVVDDIEKVASAV